MFKPKNIEPNQPQEHIPREETTRSVREQVSPSQEGKFLQELEKKRKEMKKEGKKGSVDETKEKKEDSLFGLAHTSRKKEKQSFSGGEQEGASTEQPPQEKMTQPMYAPQSEQKPAELPIEATTKQGVPTTDKPELLATETTIREPRTPIHEAVSQKKEHERTPSHITPQTVEAESIKPLAEMNVQQEKPVDVSTTRTDFMKLAEQISDGIATIIREAETTITISVKYPPLFEGASLTITEQSIAKKEFNVTFFNLSPEARKLIEMTENQHQIRQALIDRGYTLHMITIESPITAPREATATETTHEFRHHEERGEEEKKEEYPR